ncbi:hypothetical protein IRJ41_022810, partial [Triplophysa rosa]
PLQNKQVLTIFNFYEMIQRYSLLTKNSDIAMFKSKVEGIVSRVHLSLKSTSSPTPVVLWVYRTPVPISAVQDVSVLPNVSLHLKGNAPHHFNKIMYYPFSLFVSTPVPVQLPHTPVPLANTIVNVTDPPIRYLPDSRAKSDSGPDAKVMLQPRIDHTCICRALPSDCSERQLPPAPSTPASTAPGDLQDITGI